MLRPAPSSTLFPYTTLFRSAIHRLGTRRERRARVAELLELVGLPPRSEEHTSELQSLRHLVCRLLLEKKKVSAFLTPCPAARHTADRVAERRSKQRSRGRGR